jgi:hypothetical protein
MDLTAQSGRSQNEGDRPARGGGDEHPLSREQALEWLARRLYAKFEHIDPTGESWEDVDEETRDMYRSATRHLFEAPLSHLRPALPTDDDVMCL